MVHFVGAGPGSPDLITVRGKQYLEEAAPVSIHPGAIEFTRAIPARLTAKA